MKFNALILEVDYNFQFTSHPELECRGMNKEQARDLVETCRKNGIRLIPLFNCLGHQSWGPGASALLKKHPEFDETPEIPQDDKKIYCREWCPSHPDVNKIVFDLLDELIDAFDADALHVGMDEVFLIGSDKCPRCKGKDVATLFAGVVNALHQHVVTEKGIEMLMWGDRLIPSSLYYGSKWEASQTGSDRAIDMIPKDIIVCDWHYDRKNDYPPIRYFQQKGFRVLPSTWKTPEGAVALIRCSRKDATQRMLGILFTGWSAGGNGEGLLAAFQAGDDAGSTQKPATKSENQRQTARQIADTIKAGVKELDAPSDAK